MKLHFPSALLALGLVGLVAFLSSQASPPPALLNPASIRVEYMPHPRDYVQIKEGTPYTVPGGKIFVLTALGSHNSQGEAYLQIDGVEELRVRCEQFVFGAGGSPIPLGEGISMKRTPIGLTAHAGSVITILAGNGKPDDCRAWGYLATQ
jgi:hypothetical protein